MPEAPREWIDSTYEVPSGGTRYLVSADCDDSEMCFEDLQKALDSVRPGDVLELEAGTTFAGNFVLRNRPGAEWTYIQTSRLSALPKPGLRVAPANAAAMPRIVSPNAAPAIAAEFDKIVLGKKGTSVGRNGHFAVCC